MNDEQRKAIIDAMEQIARANGAIRGQLSVVENMLTVLRDNGLGLLAEADGAPAKHYTVYNQRDEDWAGVKLGTSNVTIGGYGCLISSAASMLTDAGLDVWTPATLNNWLNRNGGYTDGNRFVFNSIDKLGVVKFSNMIACESVPAPMNDLNKSINDGDFVIVKVDFDKTTSAVEEHWVRYIGGGEMIDPWRGDIAPIVPRYKGKDAAQAILRAAIYQHLK